MAEAKTPIKVEISHKTVIFTVALLIGLWFLIQIKEIIILIFLSSILLSALLKPVEWLNARRIPRVLSVLIVYFFIIALVAFVIGTIIPPLIAQSSAFGSKIPLIISTVNNFFAFNNIPVQNLSEIISRQIQQITGDFVKITATIFSSIVLVVTLLVITFYLLLDWNKFIKLIASAFSGRQEKNVINVISKIESGLGKWVRGQLTLSITVGFLTYIGLLILGIPYSLPLALIAGILEIVPIVGPIISAIPAILVGLTISPISALSTAALFVVVQQLENHLIVPMIMSRVIGLQPPVVIIALLTGAKIAGIGGAFLVIPFIVLLKIVLAELVFEDKKIEDDLGNQ